MNGVAGERVRNAATHATRKIGATRALPVDVAILVLLPVTAAILALLPVTVAILALRRAFVTRRDVVLPEENLPDVMTIGTGGKNSTATGI